MLRIYQEGPNYGKIRKTAANSKGPSYEQNTKDCKDSLPYKSKRMSHKNNYEIPLTDDEGMFCRSFLFLLHISINH